MAVAIEVFDGFDLPLYKPGQGKASLVSVTPKWTNYRSFSAENTTSFWDNLWTSGRLSGGKAIRAPFSLYRNLSLSGVTGIIVGLAFRWDNTPTVKEAFVVSAWSTDFTTHYWGVMVNASGQLQLVHGGTWNKDSASWGLSGHTVVATSPTPLTAGQWYYIEVQAPLGTNQTVKVYLNETLLIQGTIPNVASSFALWVGSNYSYKDSGGNYIAASAIDDFYCATYNSASDVPLGNVYVWTGQPQTAQITEWNATSNGHVNSVNEGYITNLSYDQQYVYTSQREKFELWGVSFPTADINSVLALQVVDYGKLEGNFSIDKVRLVIRQGSTDMVGVSASNVAANKEFWQRLLTTIKPDGSPLTPSDLNNLYYGVKTVT